MAPEPRLTAWPPLGGAQRARSAVLRLIRDAGPRKIIAALVAAALAEGVVLAGSAPAELQGSGADRLILVLVATILPLLAAVATLRPWWGLLGWLVAMPLLNVARVRLDASPVAITSSTVLIAALGVGLLLSRMPAFERSNRLAVWATGTALALALLTVVSATLNPAPETSWPVAFHGVLEPVALAALVIALRPSLTQLLQLILAMGASASIASGYNIYRLGRIATTLAEAQADRVEFARFTYYNVNIFGEILVMALPLLLAPVVLGRASALPTRVRLLLVTSLALSTLALYLTFSKGAWLGGLIGISLMLALVARGWRRKTMIVVAAAVIAMLIVPVPAYIASWLNASPGNALVQTYDSIVRGLQGTDRLSSWDPGTSAGEVSVNERLLAWKAAAAMAIDHPVLGVGPGHFGEAISGPYRPAEATRTLSSAHNVFLNIAAELGLIAAMIVLVVMTIGLVIVLRIYRRVGGVARVVALGLTASLVGYAVVATTTGADLYQPYRVMNSDVLFLALIVGAAVASADVLVTVRHQPPMGPR